MKNIRTILVVAGLLAAAGAFLAWRGRGAAPAPAARAGGARWLTDYAEAAALARRTGRPILMDFTGSDWCGWCMKLEREVFSTAEFADFAARSAVLLKVDFPRPGRLPGEVVRQNERLKRQYGVRGFPTLVLVDASGREIGRIVGYPRGGLEAIRRLAASPRRG